MKLKKLWTLPLFGMLLALRRKEAYSALAAMPDAEREQRVRDVFAVIETLRARRLHGDHGGWQEPDRRIRSLLSGLTTFWTNINAEDSAQAIEKGILGEYEGSHPLFINDSHNITGLESETLVRVFFPDVKARKRPLDGTESLVSIDKARKLIGFEPEHSVRQWY